MSTQVKVIIIEPPTEGPSFMEAPDPVLSQPAIMFSFGCLVLFHWPRTVVVPVVVQVLGTENRTEKLVAELLDLVTTTVIETTTILPINPTH